LDAVWPFGEITPHLLAQLTGAALVSARRWIRTRRMPRAMRVLAELRLFGDLGTIDPSFAGITLQRGVLTTPAGSVIDRNELESIPYRRQQVRALEARLEIRTRAHESSLAAATIKPDERADDGGDNQALHYAFLNARRG